MNPFKPKDKPVYWANEIAFGTGDPGLEAKVITEQDYLERVAAVREAAEKAKAEQTSKAITAARTLNLDDAQIALLFPHLATALAVA